MPAVTHTQRKHYFRVKQINIYEIVLSVSSVAMSIKQLMFISGLQPFTLFVQTRNDNSFKRLFILTFILFMWAITGFKPRFITLIA